MTGPRARVALLTGATSMVGRALVARLVADGWEVLATARTPRAVEAATEAGARPLYTDLDNLRQWQSEASSADVVFHLATPRITPPVHGPRTRRNARLARRGAEALAAVSDGRPVVVLSSALVYGGHDGPIGDDWPSRPLSLARAHVAAEEVLGPAEPRVLRPGWVYGAGGLMGSVIPALQARRHRIVGDGGNLWPLLSVDDAVTALLALVDAGSGIYQASEHDERPPTQNAVIDALCRGGLRKPDRVPGPMARLTLGGPLADALGASQWLPSSKLRALGWTPSRDWTAELPRLATG